MKGYIMDALPRLHGKTATQKRYFSHSGTTTAIPAIRTRLHLPNLVRLYMIK